MRRAAAAALVAGPVAIALSTLALQGGGYDIVTHQEAAIVVWLVLGSALVVGVWPAGRPAPVPLVGLGALLLLAVWAALSLAWSPSAERTATDVARDVLYVGVLASALLLPARHRRTAGGALAAAGGVVCVVALTYRLAPGALPHGLVQGALGGERLSFPLNYWNGLAAFAAMSATLLLGWSVEARVPAWRALALAGVPICLLTVYLTYSRAGVIDVVLALLALFVFVSRRVALALHAVVAGVGAAAAVVAVRAHDALAHGTSTAGAGSVALVLALAAVLALVSGAATAHRRNAARPRVPRRRAQLGVAAVALLVVGVAATAGRPALRERWDQFRRAPAAQLSSADPASRLTSGGGGRYLIWQSASDAFGAQPSHGIGSGTFELWWSRRGGQEFIRDGHSLYLETAAELGVPGVAFLLVALVALSVGAMRGRRQNGRGPLAAAWVVFLLHAGVDWLWEEPAVTVLAIASVGLAAPAPHGARLVNAWAIRATVAVTAVVAIVVQVPMLAATSLVRSSQRAERAGELSNAGALAARAVDVAPWAASPRLQQGLVAEAQGDLGDAATYLDSAVDRDRADWRPYLVLARVEAEQGRVRAAVQSVARAARLRPALRLVATGPGG